MKLFRRVLTIALFAANISVQTFFRWDFSENLVPSRLPDLESEVSRVMPCLGGGRFAGVCVYAPTPEVSMFDLTVRLGEERENLYRDACLAIKRESEAGPLRGVVRYCMKMSEENAARYYTESSGKQLLEILSFVFSSIFAGETHSGVVDAKSGCQVSEQSVFFYAEGKNDRNCS